MMSFDANKVLGHLCYQIANAPIKRWPFSHFYIQNAFPDSFYSSLIHHLPTPEAYAQGQSHYNGRKFGPQDALGELSFMLSEEFLKSVVLAFLPDFKKRFPDGNFAPKMDLRLIMDGENYAIGPHTDAKWKIVSLLFYLPKDLSLINFGTSIYIPKDRSFTCEGGPHHKFDAFTEVTRAPFLRNSLLGFFKTNQSFHGVEPITQACRRDVLLWNLYDENLR